MIRTLPTRVTLYYKDTGIIAKASNTSPGLKITRKYPAFGRGASQSTEYGPAGVYLGVCSSNYEVKCACWDEHGVPKGASANSEEDTQPVELMSDSEEDEEDELLDDSDGEDSLPDLAALNLLPVTDHAQVPDSAPVLPDVVPSASKNAKQPMSWAAASCALLSTSTPSTRLLA
jgi:hypothetical protein